MRAQHLDNLPIMTWVVLWVTRGRATMSRLFLMSCCEQCTVIFGTMFQQGGARTLDSLVAEQEKKNIRIFKRLLESGFVFKGY